MQKKAESKQQDDFLLSVKSVIDSQKFLEDQLRNWQERVFHDRQSLQAILELEFKNFMGGTQVFLTQNQEDNASSISKQKNAIKNVIRAQQPQKKTIKRPTYEKEGNQESIINIEILDDSYEQEKKEAKPHLESKPIINQAPQSLQEEKETKESQVIEFKRQRKKAVKFEPKDQKIRVQKHSQAKQKQNDVVSCDQCGKQLKRKSLKYHKIKIHGDDIK